MPNYARLDTAIDARRLDLELSWKQLADAAGISDVTLRNFRAGRSDLNTLNTRHLEDALRWERGSVNAVLNDGDPIPLDRPATPNAAAPTDDNPYADALERQIWDTTELPEDERRSWINLLRERRRATG